MVDPCSTLWHVGIEDSGATVMTPTERPKVKPSEDVATVATKILIDIPTKVRILDVTTTAKQTKLRYVYKYIRTFNTLKTNVCLYTN